MTPPSQHQARRLLEKVSHKKARVRETDHVDHDVWARTDPPVRGLNFRDRATARCCLRAGGLGAVPSNPLELPDVASRALPPAPSPNHPHARMPRVESNQSKLTVSSVPSFGKLREPLSGDSVTLENRRTRPVPVTEYEELGSEALITQVYDELDEEFGDSSPSRLFSDIGPSISVAKGIDRKKFLSTHQHLSDQYQSETPAAELPAEPVLHHHGHALDDDDSTTISGQQLAEPDFLSTTSAHKSVASMPSTATTLPPPPLPPLPAYAVERDDETAIDPVDDEAIRRVVPPPPPPLYTVENYGSTPEVPPPPSSPPPVADKKRADQDAENSSPVSDEESDDDFKEDVRDEFSDLADSSVPSMRGKWYREYGPPRSDVERDDEQKGLEQDDNFGGVEVESVEDEEYDSDADTDVPVVNPTLVGRKNHVVNAR